MPGPFTVVTFTDADGDEFPIRIGGWWTRRQRPELLKAAKETLDEFIANGDLIPTEPVKPTDIEIYGSGVWGAPSKT